MGGQCEQGEQHIKQGVSGLKSKALAQLDRQTRSRCKAIPKLDAEEAETIVARSLPKHRKSLRDWGCQGTSLPYSLDWSGPSPASVHLHPLQTSHRTHIGMRLPGPRSPLNVTYAAFSLYHLPLRDSPRLYSGIVNLLQPNPFFSTGRPTLMSLPSISVTLPAFAVAAVPLLSGTYRPYRLLPHIPTSLRLPVPAALRSEIVRLGYSQSPDQYPRLLP